MRRKTIVVAIERVLDAIDRTGVVEFISQAVSSSDENTIARIKSAFEIYSDFMVARNSFSENEIYIMNAFKLSPIADATFWQYAVVPREGPRNKVHETYFNLRNFTIYAPIIISLVKRESELKEFYINSENQEGDAKKAAKDIKFIISDDGAENITIEEFYKILKAIESLYEIVSLAYQIKENKLVVGNLDSGSEKSLDFFGVAEGIDKLSRLIMEGWEKYRYKKEEKISTELKVFENGVEVLDKLKELKDKKAITSEEHEKAKRAVFRKLGELFSSGVYTEEMLKPAQISPTQVKAQRNPLITYSEKPSNAPRRATHEPSVGPDEFDDD